MIGAIAKNRRLAIFIIITVILNLIYVLNYEIGDIESYYLPLILALSIFAAFGFINIYIYLQMKFKKDIIVLDRLIILVAVLPLFNLVMNFENVDCSGKTLPNRE